MDSIKVEGHPDLVRDVSTGAIVNNNETDYKQYMESYKKRQNQKSKIDSIESDLYEMKGELDEIKSLLRQLISK